MNIPGAASSFYSSDDGQALTEYGMILLLVTLGMVLALTALGLNILNLYQTIVAAI